MGRKPHVIERGEDEPRPVNVENHPTSYSGGLQVRRARTSEITPHTNKIAEFGSGAGVISSCGENTWLPPEASVI